jgi:hypothetical protein
MEGRAVGHTFERDPPIPARFGLIWFWINEGPKFMRYKTDNLNSKK